MRYVRLLLRTFWVRALALFEYRLDFLLALLVAFLEAGGRVFALYGALFAGLDLGGYGDGEALFVLASATLLFGYHRGVVMPNVVALSDRVRLGTLDFVLLKPLDAQVLLMFERFELSGLADLLAGGLIAAVAAARTGLGTLELLLYLAGIFLAALLYHLFAFGVSLVSFWSVYAQNAVAFLAGFLQVGSFPARAYGPALRLLFTWVLPLYWLTERPAELALGRVGPAGLFGLFLWLLAALALSRGLFSYALRGYSSASS